MGVRPRSGRFRPNSGCFRHRIWRVSAKLMAGYGQSANCSRECLQGAHVRSILACACRPCRVTRGSEKVKLSGAEGEQLSQAININHGLFVLGKAITALSEGSAHVPFRESKLTRTLALGSAGHLDVGRPPCCSLAMFPAILGLLRSLVGWPRSRC